MAIVKAVRTFRDSTTFTLNKVDLPVTERTFTLDGVELTGMNIGAFLKTSKHDVPCSDGLKWWVQWFPAGVRESAKDHVGVFLWVNKPVKTKFTFAVCDSLIAHTITYEFLNSPMGIGVDQFASHDTLRPLFSDGKLTITCNVEFDVPIPLALLKPLIFQSCDHFPTDLELVVGSESVSAHKCFLSMMSPVFHAMFTHDTVESRSNEVQITDFDLETVKAVVDFCYGQELQNLEIDTLVSILRFADKYDIKAVFAALEHIPLLNLSVETFPVVISYAYYCATDELFVECAKFFKDHQDVIKTTEEFAALPPQLVVDMLKFAFALETDIDVLRHANSEGISLVIDYLEKPLFEGIRLETFCTTICYAWECSRENLKKACAAFLDNNRQKTTKLADFVNLPPEIAIGVLKIACDL